MTEVAHRYIMENMYNEGFGQSVLKEDLGLRGGGEEKKVPQTGHCHLIISYPFYRQIFMPL